MRTQRLNTLTRFVLYCACVLLLVLAGTSLADGKLWIAALCVLTLAILLRVLSEKRRELWLRRYGLQLTGQRR